MVQSLEAKDPTGHGQVQPNHMGYLLHGGNARRTGLAEHSIISLSAVSCAEVLCTRLRSWPLRLLGENSCNLSHTFNKTITTMPFYFWSLNTSVHNVSMVDQGSTGIW